MESSSQLPHLFRSEYRKIVSVLCRSFGLRNLETAEDIASETFLTAAHTWGIEGLPPNPTAWLYAVARNKATNHVKRVNTFNSQVMAGYLQRESMMTEGQVLLEADSSDAFLEDSQLRLMFALCHPAISGEMQVTLCLRLLCGFGISEIADAFVTGKETITKRLLRAKERLRAANVSMEVPLAQLTERIEPVLTTIYLLFNEGYYANGREGVLQRELCLEAIRLATMLIGHAPTNRPETNALMALMCFHYSRFDSRLGNGGELVLYDEQDATTWNPEWVSRGGYFLQHAGEGDSITHFHLEAAIAYHHTVQGDEKWAPILKLYDQLLQVNPSPVVAMNRAYAVSKVSGAAQGIAALNGIELRNNHLYHALLGQLWTTVDKACARRHLTEAIALAQPLAIKGALRRKLEALEF